MSLVNHDRDHWMDAIQPDHLHFLDMAVATRTSLPVLISAPVESALPMAIEIATGPGGEGTDQIVVVDAADHRYLCSTLTRAAAMDRAPLRAIVVRGVEALDRNQQSALRMLVTDTAYSRTRACRIIATTSVPLFERVIQGAFDSELFYHLNNIHIKVGARRPQGH